MSEVELARKTYLKKRGARWYCRVRVPADLAGQFGKTEIVESLQTPDYREACARVEAKVRDIHRRFETARVDADPRRKIALPPPTYSEIDSMVRAWVTDRLHNVKDHGKEDDEAPSPQDIADLEEQLHALIAKDEGEDEAVEKQAVLLLAANGFPTTYKRSGKVEMRSQPVPPVDRNSPEYAHLLTRTREGMVRLLNATLLDLRGRAPSVVTLPAVSSSRAASMSLDDLISEYEKEIERKQVRPKAKDDYGLVFRALRETVGGETPIGSIDRETCRGVRDLITGMPPNVTKRFPRLSFTEAAEYAREHDLPVMKASTANSHLDKFSALFNFAVREEYLNRNPARQLGNPEGRHDGFAREPFELDQLRRIFTAPLYTGCLDDGRGWSKSGPQRPKRTRFWLPLIALLNGLRLNEIAQMAFEDVVTLRGIMGFDITNKKVEHRIKTEASRRIVPVHPRLLEFGFAEYVETIRKQGHGRLWPDLTKDTRGLYSDRFQKWHSRFLESCDAKEGGRTFHCYRHNWNDEASEAGIPMERISQLGGWTRRSVQERYGRGLKLETLASEIEKVRYTGLDLDHLK